MSRKYRVVAGPYQAARRYAQKQGWSDDEFLIITRGHQLARLDPAMIASIVTVKLNTLTARVTEEIQFEIARVKVLWPVPMQALA